MKRLTILRGSLVAAFSLITLVRVDAQTIDDQLEITRDLIQANRQVVIDDIMQLTPEEADEFWPLYDEYRADMREIGDGIKYLVFEFAGFYPNLPEDRAKNMLREMLSLEKKHTSKRAWYLKKFAKILPPDKALRFAQVENRLELATRLELAANIPLVPIEGAMAGLLTEGAAFIEGTAGGVYVETLEYSAKVAAIDPESRTLTVVSDDGIKKEIKAGPDAVNFDEIDIGDRVSLKVTEQVVVQLEHGDPVDGSAALVAVAAEGTKPGGIVAEAVRMTGTVVKIDDDNGTATLRFDDGSEATFPVRADINLSEHHIGEKVVIRVAEAVALTVTKQ